MSLRIALALTVVLTVAAACTSSGGQATSDASVDASDEQVWACGSTLVTDLPTVGGGPDASTLPPEVQLGLWEPSPAGVRLVDPDDLASWTIVEHTDGDVRIMRPIGSQTVTVAIDGAGVDVPDQHEEHGLFRAFDRERDVWFWHPRSPGGSDRCVLRAVLDGLSHPGIRLVEQPSGQDTTLRLEIDERECASGNTADGRIRHDVTFTDNTIGILLGVIPLGGSQTCQVGPPTPYIIDLGEPVRDRTIINLSFLPNRPL